MLIYEGLQMRKEALLEEGRIRRFKRSEGRVRGKCEAQAYVKPLNGEDKDPGLQTYYNSQSGKCVAALRTDDFICSSEGERFQVLKMALLIVEVF